MTATLCMASFDLPTHSASAFLLRYIAPRMEPFQLYGPIARRPFFSLAPSSDVIIGTGHGEPDEWTAQNESPVWKLGQYNPAEVKGKVVKLVSCLVGQQLGPDLVANGAAAFLGFDDDVVWLADESYWLRPWDDPYAQAVMLPIVQGVHVLLDGGTCSESLQEEKNGYLTNAQMTDSPLLKSVLQFNYDHAVLFGDPNAVVRRRPRISLPPPPPLLF
jgi:hypothetical protein